MQRWFTRLVFRKCHLNNRRQGYSYRLSFLNLESLQKRRATFDLSFLHSVYHGKQYCPDLVMRKVNVRTLMHNCRLVSDARLKGNLLLQWPHRVISKWNSIPDHIIMSSQKIFLNYIEKMP